MSTTDLGRPLTFRPVYKPVVWGGRRISRWRGDVPDGPIGESWDLSDHKDGMSVVAEGPLAGMSLASLVEKHGPALVGKGFAGGPFPLLVKLIDAADKLSVQVHPDDALARELGVGQNGKTECWLFLEEGGSLYQGTRPGIDRAAFERALAEGTVADTLNHFRPEGGDFFFLAARTVHALGAGCLVYEVQQTSNVTFRVYDWGRVGLDGKPREMHVAQSLATIDFTRTGFGPQRPEWQAHPKGGETRTLADCEYFRVEERRGAVIAGGHPEACTIAINLGSAATLSADGGAVALAPMQTALVPAAAGRWTATSDTRGRLLLATPRF